VVSFTPRPLYPQGKSSSYPLDKRLCEPQSRSGCGVCLNITFKRDSNINWLWILDIYYTIKMYKGIGGITPRIPNIGSRWRWMVSYTPRSLYHRVKSPRHTLDRKLEYIRGCIQKFPDWIITKQTTTINTGWEATERVMAAKRTRLTHKIAMQLHLVAESCTICSSSSRRPVRKLSDTLSYMYIVHKVLEDSFNLPQVAVHWNEYSIIALILRICYWFLCGNDTLKRTVLMLVFAKQTSDPTVQY
jgi:hypothetical protein